MDYSVRGKKRIVAGVLMGALVLNGCAQQEPADDTGTDIPYSSGTETNTGSEASDPGQDAEESGGGESSGESVGSTPPTDTSDKGQATSESGSDEHASADAPENEASGNEAAEGLSDYDYYMTHTSPQLDEFFTSFNTVWQENWELLWDGQSDLMPFDALQQLQDDYGQLIKDLNALEFQDSTDNIVYLETFAEQAEQAVLTRMEAAVILQEGAAGGATLDSESIQSRIPAIEEQLALSNDHVAAMNDQIAAYEDALSASNGVGQAQTEAEEQSPAEVNLELVEVEMPEISSEEAQAYYENPPSLQGGATLIIESEPFTADPRPGQGGLDLIIHGPKLSDPLPGEVISILPPVNNLEQLPEGMSHQDYYLQYTVPELNLIVNEYNRLYSQYMAGSWSFNTEDAYGSLSNNMFSLVNEFANLKTRLYSLVFLDPGPNGQYLEAYRHNMGMSMDYLIEFGHQTQSALDGVQDSYSTSVSLQSQIDYANAYVTAANEYLSYYEVVTFPETYNIPSP